MPCVRRSDRAREGPMMNRLRLVFGVLAAVGSVANGDRVILSDGRTLEGRTHDLGDHVRVETETTFHLIPHSRIVRIERDEVTRADVLDRLAAVDTTDPDALYRSAIWARENGFADEARELLTECVALRPDDVQARHALGQVRVGARWYPVAEGLAIARGWRAAGLLDRAGDLLTRLVDGATDARLRRESLRLLADTRMQQGAWDVARTLWRRSLALLREPAERAQVEARLAVLDANPDGMLLVLGTDAPSDQRESDRAPSGFFGLEQTWVMTLAMARQARRQISLGQAALERATALEAHAFVDGPERPPIAAALREAEAAFDRADALSEGIAQSHRLELARRRIGLERREAEVHADRFDEATETYRAEPGPPRSVTRTTLRRMLGHLNRVEANLAAVLVVADKYPDELDLEIQWTRMDLERVRGHQRAVKAALDATR